MDAGVFTIVPTSEARTNRIFGLRFEDSIKHEGKTHAFEKFRLVVQAYNHKTHAYLTHASTVQRVSRRSLLAICTIVAVLQIFTQDVSQAYVQSETRSHRPIFVRPPNVLDLFPQVVLRVEKPLNEIPEAGLNWYQTNYSHHSRKLSLIPAIYDPCYLYTKAVMVRDVSENPVPRWLACLHTDNTASCGNEALFQKESKMSRFDCKRQQTLSNENHILFNGASISVKDRTYAIIMKYHIDNHQKVDSCHVEKPGFVTQRAQGAYIAAVGRPDLTFGFSVRLRSLIQMREA